MIVDSVPDWGILAASLATAVATFFLWRVTKLLATETKRLADAAAQPQIVANIVPNQWSTIHLDINVENTGNATAFDVEVSFDPALTNGKARSDETPVPFQRLSVLKPGQAMKSYLSDVGDYLEKTFTVTTSWSLTPSGEERHALTYNLNMTDYAGVSYLGSRDPIVQVAEQVKKLREDWRNVANGSRKIKTDTYDASDRQREGDILEERFARRKADSAEGS